MEARQQRQAPAAEGRGIVPASELDWLRAGRAVVACEGQAVLDLSRRLDSRFSEAVALVAACRQSVVVTGVGKAGLIGQKIAATMCSTRTRARFLHPTEALHGDLGCLTPDDVMLVLSNSGESEEIVRLLPSLKERQLPIIAITAHDQNTLSRAADVTLCLGRLPEAGAHGLAPSTSTAAMLALGDALALVACEARGFTPEQFAVCHPAGSLGERLRPIRDVMRSGDQLRLASEDATIREVLTQSSRPGRRTGAVILVDAEGRLAGLFTDSDLARLLEQRRDDQLDRPVHEVMTRRPSTVPVDGILEEALQLLGAKRISELPVVDDEDRPCGLIDITDVIGLIPVEEG